MSEHDFTPGIEATLIADIYHWLQGYQPREDPTELLKRCLDFLKGKR